MNIKYSSTLLGVVLGLALLSAPAHGAVIAIDDQATFGQARTWSPGTTTFDNATLSGGTFDPSGSDKLVVAIGYRASGTPGFAGVTYNGVAMTEAVQHFSTADSRATTGIFYLDNPGAAGDLAITNNNSGFGYAVSILALSGTAAGVGATNSGNAHTTSFTVGSGSLVIAQNSISTDDTTITPQSPLTGLLQHAPLDSGSGEGSHASAYVNDPGAGTFDPTFSTAGSNPSLSAAEFTAVPEPAAALFGGLALLALLRRRR